MLKKLLHTKPYALDTGLFLLRFSFGVLMLPYGWQKFQNYAEWSKDFPDPLHIGPAASLALVVFAELLCAALVAIGLFTRLALIPLLINMIIIVLVVHGADPFEKQEHGVLFLIPYVIIFLTGPGKYSLDHALFTKR